MKGYIFVFGLLAGLSIDQTARADVVYSFVDTSYGYVGANPQPGLPLVATIDLTNATVASGSFQLAGSFFIGPPPANPYTIDTGSFVSVFFQGVSATPTSLFGDINLSLTFSPTGAITSSSFSGYTYSDEFMGSGVGNIASGFLGSDDPRCNTGVSSQLCVFSGVFTQVPEPTSGILLVTGLAAAFGLRRRLTADLT